MFRLIESSTPGEATRHNVRAHFYQRLVLMAAVCRELQSAPDRSIFGRPEAALGVLSWWMRAAYDLPENQDVNHAHGLDHPALTEFAADMKRELELGTEVCRSLAMIFTADTQSEYKADRKRIHERLNEYLAEFDLTPAAEQTQSRETEPPGGPQ